MYQPVGHQKDSAIGEKPVIVGLGRDVQQTPQCKNDADDPYRGDYQDIIAA